MTAHDINQLRSAKSVVVYDTEYTTWEGFRESGWDMPGKHMEIVQIGAVRVAPDDGWREQDTYSTLVVPKLNPELSDYFIELTGIDQQAIDKWGRPFPDALTEFVEFVEAGESVLASHGPDHEVIALNCLFSNIGLPQIFHGATNLRPWISDCLGVVEGYYTSSELPDVVGIDHEGSAHDALADSRAIAAIVRHLDTRIHESGHR